MLRSSFAIAYHYQQPEFHGSRFKCWHNCIIERCLIYLLVAAITNRIRIIFWSLNFRRNPKCYNLEFTHRSSERLTLSSMNARFWTFCSIRKLRVWGTFITFNIKYLVDFQSRRRLFFFLYFCYLTLEIEARLVRARLERKLPWNCLQTTFSCFPLLLTLTDRSKVMQT